MTQGAAQPGETVLVTGIGGVLTFALKWAVALGARVFVTSGDDRKLEQARQLGAAGGINYRADDWDKQLAKLSGGVDVVVDGTGGPAFKGCFSVLKPGGRLVIYGSTAGNSPRTGPGAIILSPSADCRLDDGIAGGVCGNAALCRRPPHCAGYRPKLRS